MMIPLPYCPSSKDMTRLKETMARRHYMLDLMTLAAIIGILVLTMGSMTNPQEEEPLHNDDESRFPTTERTDDHTPWLHPTREINKSAEVSVLASGELIAQSPALEYALTHILRPFMLEAGLTLAVHSLGIPLIVACSKWLGPYSHSGWTMRHRFVGFSRLVRKVRVNMNVRPSKVLRRMPSTISKQARAWSPARLWDNSKKAVRHLYRKRSRYSVASELTNLVPPESSSNASGDE